MKQVLLYCRQGFEKECAAEIPRLCRADRYVWFCENTQAKFMSYLNAIKQGMLSNF